MSIDPMTAYTRYRQLGRRPLALAAAALLLINAGLGIVFVTNAMRGDAASEPKDVVAVVQASAPASDVSASQFCTGVLVSPTRVLTAAHCVASRAASSIDVILDADNLCSTGPIDGERVRVTTITPVASGADAAILSLATPTSDHTAVQLARTTPSHDTDSPVVTAWGWGSGSIGGAAPCGVTPKTLQVVPLSRCAVELRAETELRQAVPSSEYFCAVPTDSSSNTCLGDSGGPAFVIEHGQRRLAGITLSGRGCGATDPGLYLGVRGIRGAVDG